MMPPQKDLSRRQPVWDAMHVLWLDTDADEFYFEHAAQTCAKSDYSLKELEQIYWREVYPAMWPNLWSIAGEWQPFDTESLSELILKRHKFGRRIWFKSMRSYAMNYWAKLKAQIEDLRSS